ncbi:DUF1573 domain-containing protein [Clostridium oryzae]|uniref:DUF1573 domain-containing protein n=1 Tax=Clostridium oryzae TaxID=1450648 RepID=UPI0009A4A9EE|nr:DUF1573 domain-containing protein [Clostridium oryzae]
MKDILLDEFQDEVENSLIRHKSILDTLTKFQESNSRVNRAIAKAVTSCGCIEVNAGKQHMPTDKDVLEDLNKCLSSHLQGKLCDNCRERIEFEIGNNIFYLTALCNLLDINIYDILIREADKITTLGKYNLR